jgi:hypothetical protein
MNDEGLKLLEEARSELNDRHRLYCNRFKCDCGIDQIITSIDRYLATGGWISAKDRLPDIGESVLVVEKGRKHVQKTCHDGRDWVLPHKSKVTHWQPLPPLPKKGE